MIGYLPNLIDYDPIASTCPHIFLTYLTERKGRMAYKSFGTRKTPQREKIPGKSQVKNNAGGFTFEIDDWARLNRFLILGSEGGSYYVGESNLTKENAEAVMRCIEQDGVRVVRTVMEISSSGRAPKNDQALFVLAMAAGIGNRDTRFVALHHGLPAVARTGTHLFDFLTYAQNFRGWGRGMRNGVSNWYIQKGVSGVQYQAVKYRQRNGWTHRDVLRKSHTINGNLSDTFGWITHKKMSPSLVGTIIDGYEQVQSAKNGKDAARIIRKFNLPREAVPTEFLSRIEVWEALLENMPITAMIRNLGKMTSIGLIKPMSQTTKMVIDVVTREDTLLKGRVHPLSILVAMKTYEQGHGVKGSMTWSPVASIVDALDDAFYLSFGTVTPTNMRTMYALDVSASMRSPDLSGMPGISPRVGSAALAMVAARTEENFMTTAFTSGGNNYMPSKCKREYFSTEYGISTLALSTKKRLDDVIRQVSRLPFGGTDCSLPMIYAMNNRIDIDTFVILTDNETWAGHIHASQAIKEYRQAMGINARVSVVSMIPNMFSIADPSDSGMLDVVGFDTATPNILAAFSLGEI